MIKSFKRQKDKDSLAVPKSTSVQNLALQQQQLNSFVPGKTLLKPPNQLQLSDKELDEEITRILNANNPHAPQNIARFNYKELAFKSHPNIDHLIVHFEYDGFLSYKGGEEGDGDAGDGEEENSLAQWAGDKRAKPPPKNQFNYAERASQTGLVGFRDRSTNTEMPPHKIFSSSVTQWTIYDAYMEDLAAKEKAKEKAAKSKKEDTSAVALALPESHYEDYKHSDDVRHLTMILERMCNQNTFDEVTQDFKYWEDAADEFREGKGVFLPLWKFEFEKEKKKTLTALQWNTKQHDLVAASFGSYDFSSQTPGLLVCFSLKNPTYPTFLFRLDTGVMCLDWHPQRPSMLAVGLYDGNVAVYDVSKKDGLVYKSDKKSKHSEPVWQVTWQKDDLDEHANFVSVSTDGRVSVWTLLKTEIISSDIIRLKRPGKPENVLHEATPEEEQLFNVAGALCIDFNASNPDVFLVGTDDGKIYQCSRAYNQQYLNIYDAHRMSVYSVKYNPFFPEVFVSCSADWTLHVWFSGNKNPILSFDLGAPINDLTWSPVSSSIFYAVADGKLYAFDLDISKFDPICDQLVTKRSKMIHVGIHSKWPIIVAGDELGHVSCFKMSPNLRKIRGKEPQNEKIRRIALSLMGRKAEI